MSPAYKAETVSLGGLLSGQRSLSIPAFQRSFAWTSREVAQLLTDLWLGVSDSRQQNGTYGGLFLGSLVVIDSDIGPWSSANATAAANATRKVIDGKQRLTTLTILLAALRDRLGAEAPWLEPLITGTGRSGGVSRLTLGLEEDAYFGVQVRRPGASIDAIEPDSENHAWRLIRQCQQVIVEDLDARSNADLLALAEFLRDEVALAMISAPDIDSGFRIFVSTNHRGKPLSAADILKAELMAGLPESQRERCLERWQAAERKLGDDFDQLPSHLRAIHGTAHGPAIRDILQLSQLKGGAERFLDAMLFPLADTLEPILNASHAGSRHSARINRTLRYLNWLRARDWVPPALAFAGRFPDQPDAFAQFLEALERLAYGMQIMGFGGDRRIARYRGVIEQLTDGPLKTDAQVPLALLLDEQGMVLLNATGNLYQRSQPTCKLLLKRLSASYPGDEIMESLSDVTVEHVLPRNLPPDSAWRLEIPNAEERDACSRLLGNLVLVTKQQNKDARNHPFAVKKRILFPDGQTSPHAITNQIMRAQNWRAGEIRAREAVLGQRLREIWSLTGKVAVKRARPAASN